MRYRELRLACSLRPQVWAAVASSAPTGGKNPRPHRDLDCAVRLRIMGRAGGEWDHRDRTSGLAVEQVQVPRMRLRRLEHVAEFEPYLKPFTAKTCVNSHDYGFATFESKAETGRILEMR